MMVLIDHLLVHELVLQIDLNPMSSLPLQYYLNKNDF